MATLPGSEGNIVNPGHEILNPIFLWLGVELALAGLLLAPEWNRVPPSAPAKS